MKAIIGCVAVLLGAMGGSDTGEARKRDLPFTPRVGRGIATLILLGLLYPATVLADLQGWRAAMDRKDYATAIRELRPVAEKGNARAQFELGIMYQEGEGIDINYVAAADWFQRAADQHYVLAQLSLGTMYVEGQGVQQDYQKGRVLLTAAAQAGNEFAALNLGKMYKNGEGINQNFAEAVRWYRVAADQDNAIGQHRVGNFYWVGQGVSRDLAEARRWLQRAADQGEPASQADLSLMYYRGDGMTPDYLQSCFWSRLALKRLEGADYRQHTFAVQQVTCKALSSEDIEKVDRMLNDWKPNCLWCERQKREFEERRRVTPDETGQASGEAAQN